MQLASSTKIDILDACILAGRVLKKAVRKDHKLLVTTFMIQKSLNNEGIFVMDVDQAHRAPAERTWKFYRRHYCERLAAETQNGSWDLPLSMLAKSGDVMVAGFLCNTRPNFITISRAFALIDYGRL
jgi:hypothetical protein